MAGSGIDICSFAALTLLFRVSEKVATPTSVILMAINTMIGFAYRQFCMGGVEEDAWGFFAVCAPIVVIGAPLGALLGSYWHRLTLAAVIYILNAVQLVVALCVIQPWSTKSTDTPLLLSLTSILIFLGGSIFFGVLSYIGLKQSANTDIATDDIEHETEKEKERLQKQADVEQQHQEEIAEKTG